MTQPREPRYDVDLPVQFAQGEGTARNLSTSGIYFETEFPLAVGTPLHFTVELDDTRAGVKRMQCEARIVRVVQKDGKVGIGARIANIKLSYADTKDAA